MPRVTRLPQIPYLATNISAASDGVCARTKAVYTSTLWFGHRSSLSFLFSGIFIESKNKKGWRPCGLN